MKQLIYFLGLVIFFISCKTDMNNKVESDKDGMIIGKPNLKFEGDIMTPEVLWSLGRLDDVQVSPDEKDLLFGITYFDIQENKGNRELYTMPVSGGEMKRITKSNTGEYQAVWSKDGRKIYFLKPADNGMQLWSMTVEGKEVKQISNIDGGISGYIFSPDENKVLYFKEVDLVKNVVDVYADLPKADARIIEDLMYRHWDSWTDSYSHIFIADFDGTSLKNDFDIMEGEEFDSPIKPFGGTEEIAWSPDSETIAWSCVKKKGKAYALSTNSDIYLFNLETKKTENLTPGMNGYDKVPVFSPDGSKLAWESMERDGYEADKNRLFIYDFNTKIKTNCTEKWDQNVHGINWSSDGKTIFTVSDYLARFQIFSINIETKEVKPITKGDHNYLSVVPMKDKIIATKQSMLYPTEIYSVSYTGEEKQISFVNKEILDKIESAKVEERRIKTTDNKDMLVWVIYPPHFDKNKKYPALLYCQGGPQSSVSQFFSYRWNFQMMAANGYVIVAPNRRGLPSFGQAWNEQISGDYGGQNMKDYLSAIDAVAKEPFIDADHLGAVGASYGGFSVFWLAGNHNKRFKAFIAHDGMFNLESQYLETEEMWFVNWDLGGPFWDTSNKAAQKSFADSPHKFVQNWDTPILVIHGGKDYRIAYTQGMSAFNAAILKGIPAKFLFFPEENHWVLKPQNGILWQREFKGWLDKYLK